MLKKLVILSMLVVSCYCVENSTEIITEETRASKNKKRTLRFLAMVILLVLSKVAIIKTAAFFFFFAFFQKLFSIGGVLLTYFMKNQLSIAVPPPPAPPAPSVAPSAAPSAAPPAAPPSYAYGYPTDYNTIGYSYGPPDHEAAFNSEGPSLTDFGTPFNWILKKP